MVQHLELSNLTPRNYQSTVRRELDSILPRKSLREKVHSAPRFLFRGFMGLEDLVDTYKEKGTDTPERDYIFADFEPDVPITYMRKGDILVQDYGWKPTRVAKFLMERGLQPIEDISEQFDDDDPDPGFMRAEMVQKRRPTLWFEQQGISIISGLMVYDFNKMLDYPPNGWGHYTLEEIGYIEESNSKTLGPNKTVAYWPIESFKDAAILLVTSNNIMNSGYR